MVEMTRWLVAALAVGVALIQCLLFLAAMLIAQAYATGLGLLASTILFGWIGWRAWNKRRPSS